MTSRSFTAPKRVARTPRHEPVGDIGKFVHYKDHVTGAFDWGCGCGEMIHVRLSINEMGDIQVDMKHRSAKRAMAIGNWEFDRLFAGEFLMRLDAVAKFKTCTKPWRS